MVIAILAVAVYSPIEGSKAHWALHLNIKDGGKEKDFIYQAAGPQNQLNLDIREDVNPSSSQRLRQHIEVSGELTSWEDIEKLQSIIKEQPMKNEISQWSCQDWVIEVLEVLNEEDLFDEYEYMNAKDTLEVLFAE